MTLAEQSTGFAEDGAPGHAVAFVFVGDLDGFGDDASHLLRIVDDNMSNLNVHG